MTMTNETLRKIEILVAEFNHNHIGANNDVTLMIQVNSGMLQRAVNAKMKLFKIIYDLEKNGYKINVKTTRDNFIASISWSK